MRKKKNKKKLNSWSKIEKTLGKAEKWSKNFSQGVQDVLVGDDYK